MPTAIGRRVGSERALVGATLSQRASCALERIDHDESQSASQVDLSWSRRDSRVEVHEHARKNQEPAGVPIGEESEPTQSIRIRGA